MARNWLAKKPHESVSTQQQRITVVRQFSRFFVARGHPAYVPDSTLSARKSIFVPRMLTDEELRKFLHTVDTLEPTARSPLRYLIMPEVFRLLYGCGFRVGEVLKLRVQYVDLNQGIITVRQGKFRKDRLVPPALSLVNRLRKYADHFERRPSDAIFFPGPNGGPFALRTVYTLFRELLLQCGIPHAGRGKGPRIHDYRHLFALHSLRRWYRDGEDLDAKLPLLATYLVSVAKRRKMATAGRDFRAKSVPCFSHSDERRLRMHSGRLFVGVVLSPRYGLPEKRSKHAEYGMNGGDWETLLPRGACDWRRI